MLSVWFQVTEKFSLITYLWCYWKKWKTGGKIFQTQLSAVKARRWKQSYVEGRGSAWNAGNEMGRITRPLEREKSTLGTQETKEDKECVFYTQSPWIHLGLTRNPYMIYSDWHENKGGPGA